MFEITCEADAWRWLSLTEHEESPEAIAFKGWPVFPVTLKGSLFHSSLTTNVMSGAIEMEACLRKAYALLRYGHANQRLNKAEREALRIVVMVRAGSTGKELDLQELASHFLNRLADKMDKQTIIILCLAVILSYTSLSLFRVWIDHQDRQLEIEKESASTQLDKEHEATLVRLAEHSLQFAMIYREAEASKPRLLKSWSEADEVSLGDIALSKDDINRLTANQREKPIEFDIHGLFFIDLVNAKPVDEIRLTVRDAADNGMRIPIAIRPNELPAEQMSLIKEASFAKTPLSLTLHAKQSKGDIKSAVLIKVEAP